MKKELAILGMILLVSACNKSENSGFLCEQPGNVATYKAIDGSTNSFVYNQKNQKYDIKSSKPIDPDHDVSDITSIDIINRKNGVNIGYFILLDKSMFGFNSWKDNYLNCQKISQNENSIVASCNYSDSITTKFSYSKDKGVVSMTHHCPNCGTGHTEVLVSEYGIGKSCY